MMTTIGFELLFLLLLILANGALSMSELAVVSARKMRLQQMADDGKPGAGTALQLAEAPGRFLSSVQIGITLAGILSGALGGARLAGMISAPLSRLPYMATYADVIGVALVAVAITYFTLVLGELVPKRLALRSPERVAAAVARPMAVLARITAPLVNLLSASTEFVLLVLGIRGEPEPAVTEEEVRMMLEQGAELGVFEPMEEEIVGQVFRLADRKVGALITPRPEIVWIEVEDSVETMREKIVASGRSRFPVAERDLDRLIGIVLAKDLLAQCLAGGPIDLRSVLRPALYVPESMPALTVVERFKESQTKMAVVIDEYGGVEGIVTVDDVLEAMVGDISGPDEEGEPEAVQREDGTWLVDGMFPIDRFQDLFDIDALPYETEGYYQTVGGLVMASLGQIPVTGDHFEWEGLRIEVVDMDGRRVDKVLIARVPES
jgi:putative hemolysin